MELKKTVTPSRPVKKNHTKATEKRMSSIFRSMSNISRLEILKVLYSKGSTSYTDLKALAGFGSKKESGKFAYHLRDLTALALVERNKSERRYNITNQGKLVLELAGKIEENAFMESGKLQVRSSSASIDEFKKHRIVQSLVKEGNMPHELAEKITKEVENKIHKYEISYITGSLIRDMVNSVLLETNNEEYRNKLVRLGMPLHDVQQMLYNLDEVDGGMESLISRAGRNVFVENTMFGSLQKDVADRHMAGTIHISNVGTWFALPDVIFVNIKDLLDGGMNIGGKHASASRIQRFGGPSDAMASVCIMLHLLSREASEEVVVSGLPRLLAKRCPDAGDAEMEAGLLWMFAVSSVVPAHTKEGGNITSIRLNMGHDDARLVDCVINAYSRYVRLTPRPRIGLVIGYDKGSIESVSGRLADIVIAGGRVLLTKSQQVSSRGVSGGSLNKTDSKMSMALQSVSVNLAGLAYEVGRGDAEYFMARLVLLLKPVVDAIITRKKELFENTRRGLNPLIARNTQYMQYGYASLTINLVGLREAVFEGLGFEYNRKGRETVQKIITHAVDAGTNGAREAGERVTICIADAPEAGERFARLDGKKYGKHVSGPGQTRPYTQGLVFEVSDIEKYTNKSPPITLSNRMSRSLNAGLQVVLRIPETETNPDVVQEAIEKMATLVPTFSPSKEVIVCAECGFKDRPFDSKCPKCQTPRRVPV